ncbi:UNVERIFIED_CONTAM: hypothetical protein FKN15_066494 [Acipenser sinensis]
MAEVSVAERSGPICLASSDAESSCAREIRNLQPHFCISSEDCALESAVVRVINPCERWESSEELQESSSISLVAREILQEAPELLTLQLALLLRGAILFESISAPSKDRKLTNDQEELLCVMEKKFGELPRREDVITVLKSARPTFQGANIEELLLKEVKELSDGDIKVAISTVHMNLEAVFHTAARYALPRLCDCTRSGLDTRPSTLPEPVTSELRLVLGMLLQVSGFQGQALGRSLACIIVAHRQLWLSQARVPDAFGPAVEEILQCSH